MRLVTTIGIINLNRIFDVQPVGSLFMNSSSGIGPDYSQTAPSIYPITSPGIVSEWQSRTGYFWRLGVFGGVSGDPGLRARLNSPASSVITLLLS